MTMEGEKREMTNMGGGCEKGDECRDGVEPPRPLWCTVVIEVSGTAGRGRATHVEQN